MTDLQTQALTVADQASAIVVRDQASLTAANQFLLAVKALLKEIASTFDPIIDKAHQAHKEALEKKKKHEAPLLQAERIVKGLVGNYLQEEERKRREAEAEAYRVEQEKIRAEAEKTRLADEALKKAAAAEAKGEGEKVDAILDRAAAKIDKVDAAIPAPAPPPPPKPVTAPGISSREVWLFQVVDPDLVPREFMVVDESKIRRVVQAMKSGSKIPGVRVWSEKQIAARA